MQECAKYCPLNLQRSFNTHILKQNLLWFYWTLACVLGVLTVRLCARWAVFSLTLLSDGLIQCVAVFSSHSSMFYVVSFPHCEYQVFYCLCAYDVPLLPLATITAAMISWHASVSTNPLKTQLFSLSLHVAQSCSKWDFFYAVRLICIESKFCTKCLHTTWSSISPLVGTLSVDTQILLSYLCRFSSWKSGAQYVLIWAQSFRVELKFNNHRTCLDPQHGCVSWTPGITPRALNETATKKQRRRERKTLPTNTLTLSMPHMGYGLPSCM